MLSEYLTPKGDEAVAAMEIRIVDQRVKGSIIARELRLAPAREVPVLAPERLK